MSKERLEEIRNRMIVEKHYFKYLNSDKGYWENVYTLLEQDMKYLFDNIIEQSERIQKLDELVIAYQTELYTRDNANKRNKEQNKRYREAIEFGIEYLKNSDIRQVQLVVTALKSALEESE